MVSVNKITIIGNLGSDPEMRFTPAGKAVTSFRVATNYRVNSSDGEKRDETEWFNVVCFGRTAEACNQFLQKGQLAYVEGRIKLNTWEGNDGQQKSRMEIVANEVKFLDRKATVVDNDVEKDGAPF